MDLFVLKKDNETYFNLFNKLVEEVIEVREEMIAYKKENLVSEILDVIQVCIGILDKLEQDGIKIKKEIEKHNLKLLQRGWIYKKVLHIDVE